MGSASRLLIEGGSVWTPDVILDDATVVVEGERIADITSAPPAAVRADDERIDARGLFVLPGLIDTHSHHREPGFTHKEDIASATRAAAAGGVTTTIGMPNVQPPVTTPELYDAAMRLYEEKAVVDYNLHPSATDLGSIPALAAAGAAGFKIWMVEDTKRTYPHMPGLGVHDDAMLLEIFEAVAATDLPLMIHPHNQSLMTIAEERQRESGDRSPLAYGRAQRFYDGLVWDTAIQTLLRIQESVGTRLHVLHLITTRSVQLIRDAKRRSDRVTAEVNPFGLFLGDPALIEERGPYVMGRLVPEDVKDALWEGLRDGAIDVIGTDHAPHAREEKELGWDDMWKAPSGTPQLQDYLSQLLDHGVREARIDMDVLARTCSYNPAQIFGLAPRKGTIAPGADADLVLIDPELQVRFRDEDAISKCGWTPYAGQVATGGPLHTLVRGRFVFRDRQLVAEAGWGRKASPEGRGSK